MSELWAKIKSGSEYLSSWLTATKVGDSKALDVNVVKAVATESSIDLSGLEALLTALNGYVDGLEGYTDGLEGLLSAPTSQSMGRVAVTSGAKQFIEASTPCKVVYVEALSTNVGKVAVGASNQVSISGGSELGLILSANEKIPVEIDNINKLYVNGAAGDGIIYAGW